MTDVKKPADDSGAQLDAELESIAELLEGDFGEALGDLLGAPPPLPPPPEEQLLTSAVRPAPRGGARRPVSAPTPALAPPTDDEIFGSADIDAAFAHSSAPDDDDEPEMEISAGAPDDDEAPEEPPPGDDGELAGDDGEQPFAEKTRMAAVDDQLLRQARRSPTEDGARAPGRRGPAIVRRDRLTRPPASEEHDESTRIADPGFQMAQLERDLEQELAAADEAPPATAGELDESFYDGIEIGASSAEDQAAPQARSNPLVQRRVTRNVVRRAETSTSGSTRSSGPQAIPPAAEARPAEPDLLTTGVFGRKEPAAAKSAPVGPAPVAAAPSTPPAAGGPVRALTPSGNLPALAEEIAEVASSADDASGSNPLIDVLADFRRAEGTGVTGPPATDLSIDLEGGLESAFSAAFPDEVQVATGSASDDDAEAEHATDGSGEAEDDVSIEVSANANDDDDDDDVTVLSAVPVPPEEAAATPHLEPAEGAAAAPPALVLDLAIDAARLQLPETAADAGDDVETDLIFELTQIEQEIERAHALPPDPAQRARLHLRAGAVSERLGDLDRAREHYEESSQADHDLLPAARALRKLLFRRGEFQEGLRRLDHELALVSTEERRSLDAFRADLLLAVGEQDLARVAYGELVDARPDDLRSLLAQIELAYSDDREDELLVAVVAAAAHVRDPELAAALHLLAARLHERAGRDDDAVAAFQAALAARPEERLARWGLLRLSLRTGRPADASRHGEELLSGSSDGALVAAAARRRALAALAAEEVEAATRALAAAGDVADPLLLELAADAHERAGRVPEAARTLQIWAGVEPAAIRRAEVLHRLVALEEGDEAERALSDAADADPGDTDALAELAARRLTAGDIDAAVGFERGAAASEPEAAAGAHLRAAALLAAAGRHDEAVTELRAADAVRPGTPLVVDALARGLEQAHRLGELADLYAEAGEVVSCGPAAARERAARASETLAMRAADPASAPSAEDAWKALRGVEPGAWVAHAALERLAGARGDRAGLADVLAAQLAAVRDPLRQSLIAARRAVLLTAVGDEAEATSTLEEAVGADRSDARATDRLALGQASGGRWHEAAEALAARAEAISDSPEKDSLRYRAAVLFETENEPSRAATLLAPALASQPAFAGAAVLLERLQRRLGDSEGLAALLERETRAAGDEPADGRVARLVRLAEILAESGDSARAAALYREALGMRSDDPIVRDGFRRVAIAAHEVAPLADMALGDLKRAEERGDLAGKVAAYEELARIDGDLRGDVASATMAWQSAIELDPQHMPALRALERTYLGVPESSPEKKTVELAGVYAKLGAALADSPADAFPVVLERARLHERQGQLPAAIADHREALGLARPRMSLFRLEMRAREAGALEEIAALDDAIAEYFSGDARGQAAFLTRAGEALADLGRPDDALARFHAAAEVLPGFAPALRAWRRVALLNERWADVVNACEREAQVARTDEERVALYHLAGVTAMERAGDPERAGRALRHVLVLDPRLQDAFKRLRKLFSSPEHKAELAELLTARVEIETHPGRLIELHQTLALLYRDALGDPDRAKAHLRAVLARDPRNLPAVTALSELAWSQESWSEAAEALIQRARLEKSPEILKDIFFQLGVIYAEKLPDRRWAVKSFERVLQHDPNDLRALEHLSALTVEAGDWGTALAATERLVSLDSDPGVKVKHLLRVSHIHESGNQDRKRAEDALRRALDADPTSTEALAALVGFFGRLRDTASLRVNLDRVASAMRARLERDLFDGVPYRLLARALEARADAGVGGSIDAARCAAELAELLGSAEDSDRQLAQQARATLPVVKGLGLLHIDELLFHPAVPNGLRQLFRLLYDTLGKRFPPDLRRAGVSKADRLPKTGHPVREILARVALDLGLGDFDVYVSSSRPAAFAVELTDPLSVIIGSGVAQAGEAQLRFAGARAMKLATSYMAVPASLGPEELGVLLAAVIRQYNPGFTPPGVNVAAIGEETQRLARLIPKRLRDEIVRFATEISGHALDHHALWLGVQHTGNRAGLIACGSVRAGLDVLLRAGNHRELRAARGDAQIEELMRFAVSNEHCEVRAALAV